MMTMMTIIYAVKLKVLSKYG